MRKYLLKFGLICGSLIVITTCTEESTEYFLKVKPKVFAEVDLFSKDAVYDYLFDSEENDVDSLKDLSRGEFLKGIDLYKNKKNPKDAIKLFKSSILIFPDAKAYYELGNALMETKESRESLWNAYDAFEIAEVLNFQPIANVHYRKACAQNLILELGEVKGEKNVYHWSVGSSLRDAFMAGFEDTVLLMSDKRLSSYTSTEEFREVMTDIRSRKVKNSGGGLFAAFTQAFPVIQGEFVIKYEDVAMEKYSQSISYDFAGFIPEMENTAFGREVSHDYFYVGKMMETSEYTALIYSSISFFGEEMQPVNVTLATYDKNGKIISRKMIGCQCSSEKIKVCKIKDGVISIEDQQRIWAEPIDKVPFSENRVKSHDAIAKASFKIEDSGKIIDFDVPANYKDSSVIVKN